ncbi:MAG: dihydroorotate dehydrogenase [Robiginitomaculum sp.]|nr:MAG: dihydroorotate dehydrogenase [Robiginitomaculum sp.]
MEEIIYRLMDSESWRDVQARGLFTGSAHDKRDGFIHFSTATTVRETARRYYAHCDDLLLLSVQAAPLGDDLKWEPSRGGVLFPHLYAPLRTDQVIAAKRLVRNDQGHVFEAYIP